MSGSHQRASRKSKPTSTNFQRLAKQFVIDYEDGEDGEYEKDDLVGVFHEALYALSESPTFTHMMRETGRKPYKVIFDDTMEEYGAIEPDDRIIYLSSHAPPAQLITTLAHEIRHAYQYKTVLHTDQVDRMKKRDFTVWNMLLEADAASTEAQVLAEIQHTPMGKPARDAAKALPLYRTVHAAFERAVEKNPDALRTGDAQLAGFKRYFRTKLVDIYKAGFSEYHKELRKDGIQADLTIPDTAAKQLGWHHSGGNYLDRDRQLVNRTGASLRRNPVFLGTSKPKRGRNQRLMDPRRVSLLAEKAHNIMIPAFARPIRPQGHEGPPLRPF
jgi:hypothetical protein